jgi:hypothetical protein
MSRTWKGRRPQGRRSAACNQRLNINNNVVMKIYRTDARQWFGEIVFRKVWPGIRTFVPFDARATPRELKREMMDWLIYHLRREPAYTDEATDNIQEDS